MIFRLGYMRSLARWPSLGLVCILLLLTNAAADAPATNLTATTLGQVRFSFAVFSPNGEQVLTNEIPAGPVPGEAAALWDVKTGQIVRRFIGHNGSVLAGAFSPDGKQIVTGGGTGHSGLPGPANAELRLWNLASGREIRQYRGHEHIVLSVCFTPDGKRILSVANGYLARLWDVESGRQIFAWPKGKQEGAVSAALSYDGRFVLTNQSDRLTVWNTSSGEEAVQIERPSPDGNFIAAHFSPDAKLIASASYDNTARTWDANTGKPALLFTGHASFVNQVRFSANGKWVVTASSDKTARIWEVATGKEIRAFSHPGRVTDVQFSADSKRLVAVWRPEQGPIPHYLAGISLWDTQSGEEIRRISTQNDQCQPGPVVFTPDGKALLVHVERTDLLDCETGKTIREYR
jgi:WD40 repeat protein